MVLPLVILATLADGKSLPAVKCDVAQPPSAKQTAITAMRLFISVLDVEVLQILAGIEAKSHCRVDQLLSRAHSNQNALGALATLLSRRHRLDSWLAGISVRAARTSC
ncbi:hypothetical protein D3C75_749970 [compost metagenome]